MIDAVLKQGSVKVQLPGRRIRGDLPAKGRGFTDFAAYDDARRRVGARQFPRAVSVGGPVARSQERVEVALPTGGDLVGLDEELCKQLLGEGRAF